MNGETEKSSEINTPEGQEDSVCYGKTLKDKIPPEILEEILKDSK